MKHFRTLAAFAAAACLTAGCSPAGDEYRLLVGTRTGEEPRAGVFLFSLDPESLEYKTLDSAGAANPTFVIQSASNPRRAYSVGEFEDGEREALYSYTLDGDNLEIAAVRPLPVIGGISAGSPCNVVEYCGYVATSNYTGGTISVLPLDSRGLAEPELERFAPASVSGFPAAPEHHIHCAVLSPDGEFLFATDLGADCIYRFSVAEGQPLGEPAIAFAFDPADHPGPRHLVFNGRGDRAYLISEVGDLLTTFAYSEGRLEHLSSIPAYDGGGHGSGDIHLSPDGRFLFTSHRLKKDGIALFRVDGGDGLPEPAGYFPTGRHPRNFAISPDGRYLLCACRDDNRIEIYAVDPDSGALSFSGRSIRVNAPTCVQFLR